MLKSIVVTLCATVLLSLLACGGSGGESVNTRQASDAVLVCRQYFSDDPNHTVNCVEYMQNAVDSIGRRCSSTVDTVGEIDSIAFMMAESSEPCPRNFITSCQGLIGSQQAIRFFMYDGIDNSCFDIQMDTLIEN